MNPQMNRAISFFTTTLNKKDKIEIDVTTLSISPESVPGLLHLWTVAKSAVVI